MIINLGCASVDNHIPRDDIFDYHPIRECNIYILFGTYRVSAQLYIGATDLARLPSMGTIFWAFVARLLQANGVEHDEAHTLSASHYGPLLPRQRNAILMAFRWQANTCPILHAYWVVCGFLSGFPLYAYGTIGHKLGIKKLSLNCFSGNLEINWSSTWSCRMANVNILEYTSLAGGYLNAVDNGTCSRIHANFADIFRHIVT